MKQTPTELLKCFVTSFEDSILEGCSIEHFCDLVQGEELCYGAKCEECPLYNAAVLRSVIVELTKEV